MCFFVRQSKEATELQSRFRAAPEDTTQLVPMAFINGFIYPKTPVITHEFPDVIKLFNWGLIPAWAKDKTIRKNTLNARIETLHEKPSFKNNVANRCLVLADGFYEWKWLDKKGKLKEKYLITLPGDELFAFAGIYAHWQNTDTEEMIKSYSIVTTEANELMSRIHNSRQRMPVVLTANNEKNWLEGQNLKEFARVEANLKAQLCLKGS